MKKVCFKKEFERRLARFYNALLTYKTNGSSGDILPALFSCASYCWCKSPYKNMHSINLEGVINEDGTFYEFTDEFREVLSQWYEEKTGKFLLPDSYDYNHLGLQPKHK